ncbi:MAG: acyl-CoA dehydrogenase family protein [Proteobacteria bacterium]|nr:acyl-CoA dehydrogenase family protein [Pseudomonadota bacterium]
MDFTWSAELIEFRDELTQVIQQWRTPELLKEYRENHGAAGPLISEFQAELNRRGWSRMCWPEEYGGRALNPLYQFVYVETMEYWGMPYGNLTYTSVAPALLEHASEEQKKEYLPGIWEGRLRFAIGYSEPNAGSDLASLRTRAVRDGDDWIIQGQKIWTSGAEVATHVWLAARTDPDAPRHQGISMIIVPVDAPGVTVRPLWTMSGVRTNETFYDNVRVPYSNLVGPLNGGWTIIMHALNHERVGLSTTGNLAVHFDDAVRYLREHRPEALADPHVRRRLAEIKLELLKHRALAIRNAVTIAGGGIKPQEASMTKIHGSELRYSLSNSLMDLLGRYGGLSRETGELAPAEGSFERTWRASPILRFGGGANELQRTIIATRGLGMPR